MTKIKELKDNPHLTWGADCYIEIYENMPLLRY